MSDGTVSREERINVKLADVLSKRALDADAETIWAEGRPDVLVNLSGLKLIIEGRIENQRASLIVDARKRIEDGMCEVSLAVCYPKLLYEIKQALLEKEIERTRFKGALFYYAKSSIREDEFSDYGVDELTDLIRQAVVLLVDNDIIREQVGNVERIMGNVVSRAAATNLFFNSETVKKRLAQALGINPSANAKDARPENGEEEDE